MLNKLVYYIVGVCIGLILAMLNDYVDLTPIWVRLVLIAVGAIFVYVIESLSEDYNI